MTRPLACACEGFECGVVSETHVILFTFNLIAALNVVSFVDSVGPALYAQFAVFFFAGRFCYPVF